MVVLFEKGGLVNQNKGFSAAGGTDNDSMTAVLFPAQAFLVMIQAFETAVSLGV